MSTSNFLGMDPNEVKSQGDQTKQQGETINDTKTTADQTIQSFVGEAWHGDDAQQFGEAWQEVSQAFDAIHSALEDRVADIQKQVADQEQVSAN